MITTFFLSEIKRAFRAPMVYIFFFLFAILAFGAVASDNVIIGGAIGNIFKNAPHVIVNFTITMSLIGILVATAFFNNAALRDYQNQFNEILFSTPISKASFFFGRFFGALVLATVPIIGVYVGMLLGGIIGPLAGWVGEERIGPVMGLSYVSSYFMFALPNMFIAGAIIYACANIWKSTVISFVAALSIIVLYAVSGSLLSDVENESLAAMVDLFGARTYSVYSQYFTPSEKNAYISLFSGILISNRVLWLGIASGILGLSFWRFSFRTRTSKKGLKKKTQKSPVRKSKILELAPVKTTAIFDLGTKWAQFKSFYVANTLNIVKSSAFTILFVFAVILLMSEMLQGFEYFGLQAFPVTYKMMDQIESSTVLFIMIIAVFFSGELVWRDRQHHISEVINATPHVSFTSLLAKATSLVTIPVLMYVFFVLVSIVYQLANGYTRIELGLYFQNFFYKSFPLFVTWSTVFILIQVLVSNRYVGYFVSILLLIASDIILSAFDIQTNMLSIGGGPFLTYSDMNGFGPGVEGKLWFNAYWMLFGVILLFVAGLLWPRGSSNRLKDRWGTAKASFKGKTAISFAVVFGVWLLVAGNVYYNSQILNPYKTSDEREQQAVDYEKTYKKYQGIPQPVITDAKHYLDIFPEERDLHVKADLTMKNLHATPIKDLHFNVFEEIKTTIDIPGATLTMNDEDFGYQIYTLAHPMMPGDSFVVHIESEFISKGFENGTPGTQVIRNGSFLNNFGILPSIGYDESQELGDKNTRRKYDLKPKDRVPALAMGPCVRECMHNYLTDGAADWVNMETVISTSADQIAIAPGSLVKEWTEGDRKYFHYVVDHPSQYFANFVSADFEVYRRKWNGIDIEIYYDAKHSGNVEMMADAVEKSLKYYTENFGPYYHKQARIIEFPRYATFAQAFPGTMPYSESFGFITDLSDTTENNVVDAVIAHEMAHQWWAHQEIPAKMQGGTMLTESFSEYSSLMVMKQEKTDLQMKDFLKYDMNRYLGGRSVETEKEVPLSKVENQGYVHYGKGAVILYALQDYVGEEKVNTAMKGFLEEYRYAPPPYPNSNDFMRYLKPQVPDSLQYLIEDWFNTITLYDFRMKDASYTASGSGNYTVNLDLEAYKVRADSIGNESRVEFNDWVDIGIYADKDEEKLLKVERVKLQQGESQYSITVDEVPAKAAIDPKRLLIERVIDDNVKSVSEGK